MDGLAGILIEFVVVHGLAERVSSQGVNVFYPYVLFQDVVVRFLL